MTGLDISYSHSLHEIYQNVKTAQTNENGK